MFYVVDTWMFIYLFFFSLLMPKTKLAYRNVMKILMKFQSITNCKTQSLSMISDMDSQNVPFGLPFSTSYIPNMFRWLGGVRAKFNEKRRISQVLIIFHRIVLQQIKQFRNCWKKKKTCELQFQFIFQLHFL